MKRIYRVLAIVLTLALLLSGCSLFDRLSGTRNDVVDGFVQGTLPEESTTPDGTIVPSEATEPEETTVPEETTAPDKEISFGKWEGTTYTNRYIGAGCNLDSAWTIRKADELQTITGAIKDVYSETELSEIFANAQQIMDMQAENTTDLVSMNLLYTKLTPVQKLSFMMASEEKVVDDTLATKDQLIQAYAQAGIEDAQMEKVSVTFMGKQRFAIHTSAKVSGVNYYILQFFDYDNGDYYTCLSLASYVTDKTTELMELWFAVD